ncbi:Hsp20 family protein [Deinococcus sp. HMF7620]|uniref:Hsp20 family protein n=1 Tax=Deinococcus arboris TaxID=2682977 RepID=A0A7C9LQU3_9DEIO|nr:Hsp20/alpha crystallin family protein [Deinococcus arboris]MVN88856.1 Hsp20 family protein [Deinococcus arboris]
MNEPVLARLHHLMTLREEVETLSAPAVWSPAADWTEDDTHLLLCLDVPGVAAETLEVQEDGGQVTVAGHREAAPRLLSGERPSGPFSRTLTFPEAVLPQSGVASLSSGVLTIRFEKRHPTINVPSSDLNGEGR